MVFCMAALYPFTGEFYYTSIYFSMFVSLSAISVVLFRFASDWKRVLLAGSILLVSKAFIDYTTSGLENCQLYLCMVLFYWLVFYKDSSRNLVLFATAFFASMLMFSRMDTIILCFPLLLLAWWEKRSNRLKSCAGPTPMCTPSM